VFVRFIWRMLAWVVRKLLGRGKPPVAPGYTGAAD
jgi:hypothetical protein